MVLATIFALAVFAVILYFSLRILGNVFKGLLIVGVIFLASLIIIGSFPEIRTIPIIGRLIPDLSGFPTTTGEFIRTVGGFFYNLEITGHDRTSSGNLLVIVKNRGMMGLKGFNAMVNGQNMTIVNNPKEPLDSGDWTTVEMDWKQDFENITITTERTSDFYKTE